MSTKVESIRTEIEQLVAEGYKLFFAEVTGFDVSKEPKDVGKATKGKSKENANKKTADILQDKVVASLIFPTEYQSWYTATLPIIEQLLPDRYPEFVDYYKPKRKSNVQHYSALDFGIEDYLLGMRVTRGGIDVLNGKSIFGLKFKCQVDILKSAVNRLESKLADIRGTFEAE